MNASDIASALGKLGLGHKKTMTAEAIKQRRSAAKISARKRKGKKRAINENASVGTANASTLQKYNVDLS